MKKIFTIFAASLLALALTGCSPSSTPVADSGAASQVQSLQGETIELTADLADQGYEYWGNGADLIYRWASDSEQNDIPCYSTWCNAIHVKAISSCKSVAYEYDELDAQDQVISHRSNGLSLEEDPSGEYAPGWGFVLSDMSMAKTFQLTSMVCSTGEYDYNSRNDGNSDANSGVQQPDSEGSQVQQPQTPKGHYETQCTKVWVANHDPNQNGTTSIGTWENQCRQVWVNW